MVHTLESGQAGHETARNNWRGQNKGACSRPGRNRQSSRLNDRPKTIRALNFRILKSVLPIAPIPKSVKSVGKSVARSIGKLN